MSHSTRPRYMASCTAAATPEPDEPLVPDPIAGREDEPLKPMDSDLPYGRRAAGRIYSVVVLVALVIAGTDAMLLVNPDRGVDPLLGAPWPR